MESKYGCSKVILILSGCLFFMAAIFLYLRKNPSMDSIDGFRFLYKDSLSMQNGTLVCRLGDGYFSSIFKNLSGQRKLYSHIGILQKEKDSCYVIHAEASELTAIGSVRKESLAYFVSHAKSYAFFEIHDDTLAAKAVKYAQSYYDKHTPFDAEFDLSSDSAVYCTELIANCINKACQDSVIQHNGNLNGFIYYQLDDILDGVERMNKNFDLKQD